MRFLVRVLDVGCFDNVSVYARSHCAVGNCEGNGNDVSSICHFDQVERSGTRGEISLEVNLGFLSGRFLGYSLREFGLRRPLEMTSIGNALKAQNDMYRKRVKRAKQ